MSISDEQRSTLISHRLDSAHEALEDARVLRDRQSLTLSYAQVDTRLDEATRFVEVISNFLSGVKL